MATTNNGTTVRKAPSIAGIVALIGKNGEAYARANIVAALKANAPAGHMASDEFYGAVADNRIGFARVLLRISGHIGGMPEHWLLRDGKVTNVQTGARTVVLDTDTLRAVSVLISNAMEHNKPV